MITIKAVPTQAIFLGRVGENERLRVAFDVGPYLTEYPGASFVLLNQGPEDAQPYPCAEVALDGTTLYWVITSADVHAEGRGRCELIVTVDDVTAKSIIFDTRIMRSLIGTGAVPPEWAAWLETFAEYKADAETAATEAEVASEAIQDMSVVASTRDPGTGATVGKFVNPETGAVQLRFGIPQGAPGVSPEIYVLNIEGGHRVIIIRADGTSLTFDVMDGTDGADGATGPQGEPGFSPTVQVTDITGGHQVAITDLEGTHTFDVMDGEVTQEEFDELKSAIFTEVEPVYALNNIPNVVKKASFNSYPISNQTAIKLEPSTAYDSYACVLSEPAALYVKPSEMTSAYFTISYGTNCTGTRESSGNLYYDCTNALRVRLSDNNLPTENNRLTLQAGDVIVITITAGASENIYGLTTINGINEDFQAQILGALPNDVAMLQDETDLIFTEADAKTSLANLPYLYYKTGYNSFATGDGTAVKLEATAGYDSYACVLTEDADIYVDPDAITAAYFSIAYGSNYTSTTETSGNYFMYCTNAQRVRLSENNLPTIDNKLSLHTGDVVSFTVTAGSTAYVYGFGQVLVVRDEFKADILSKPHLRYINGSGPNSSSERVEVYVPTADGYTRYDFLHTEKADINADVWRVGYAYHARDDFSEDFALTSTGEWECAIKLNGRSDFSGGYAHGDEVYTGITWLLDGQAVDITDYTELTPFSDLSIFEQSNLYDPNDGTTVFAAHGSEHHFTADGMTIRQSVKFTSAVTVTNAYLAMLPITKAISGTLVPDSTFAEVSTSSAVRLYDTEAVTIFDDAKNAKTEFSVPKWEFLSTGDYTFMCVDNGSTEYNKCYFVNTLSDVAVAQNKLIKTETKYNIVVG